ncbi:MAG: FkbM family methyltransferase [Alphaproteobacteria bacterium]
MAPMSPSPSAPSRDGPFDWRELGWPGRVRRAAHLWKAFAYDHHRELVPMLRPLVPADGVVLDVGAHAGQFAKLFASLVPRGRVYAFEPGSYARSILARVVRWRHLGNVEIVAMGLGDAPGQARLAMPIKRSGAYGFGLSHLGGADRPGPVRTETVEIGTIDTFVRARALRRVDFIKADVEGWEGRMLAGAEQTLERFRPALMLELIGSHLTRAGDGLEAVWTSLERRGYRPYLVGAQEGPRAISAPQDGEILWRPN